MNILIAGVGGQGTLLASRVLGTYAIEKGLDCKLSEVHGMAQRGGSVVTFVRMGDKVHSPLIEEGEADVILAFERLEALRWAHYLKKGGILMYSSQEIMPMPVVIGAAKYPHGQSPKNSLEIPALETALNLGNTKVANTVMLGALSKKMGLDYNVALESLLKNIPQKTIELNTKAFNAGYNM